MSVGDVFNYVADVSVIAFVASPGTVVSLAHVRRERSNGPQRRAAPPVRRLSAECVATGLVRLACADRSARSQPF